MKTIEQILLEIHMQRPLSRSGLYRYINTLGIEPLGARQKPQRYPADTARRILTHLGIWAADGCGRPDCPNSNGNGNGGPKVTTPSMRELKAARARGSR